MLIYIDASVAGISGDMIIGSLLDLGTKEESIYVVEREISKVLGHPVKITIKDVKKHGMTSKGVTVDTFEESLSTKKLKENVASLTKILKLDIEAKKFSIETLMTLLRAEEKVHGEKEDPHLHELGSVDTLVDILGTAKLMQELDFFDKNVNVYSSSVAVGNGTIETSHGTLSIPTPVTTEILRRFKIPFKFSHEDGELATPTGVAILGNIAHSFKSPFYPVKVENTGRGSDRYDFKSFPNILRIMKLSSKKGIEEVSIVETSVDDVTGEVLGYVIKKLYDKGAFDVQVIPTISKKNRPSYIIFVLGKVGSEEELARILMEEIGTLGVRILPAQMRMVSKRKLENIKISINGFKETARVKVSYSRGKKHVKAEFEDAKKIAAKTGIPLKDVIKEIEKRAT